MEISMSSREVLTKIKEMYQSGEALNKKKIKKSDPELMRNALYHYPSWEHVVKEVEAK